MAFRPRRLRRTRKARRNRKRGGQPSKVTPETPGVQRGRKKRRDPSSGAPSRQRRNARTAAIRTGEFAGKTVAVGAGLGLGGAGLGKLLEGLGGGAGSFFEEAQRPGEQTDLLARLAREGVLTPELANALGGGPGGQGQQVAGLDARTLLLLGAVGVGGFFLIREVQSDG